VATKPTLTVDPRDIIVAGDVTLIGTCWSFENTGADGAVVKGTGKGAIVLRRQDGTWVIAVENPWAEVV